MLAVDETQSKAKGSGLMIVAGCIVICYLLAGVFRGKGK